MPYLALRTEEKEAFSRLERDILQIAVRSSGDIRPVDLVRELGIHPRTARKGLGTLCEKGIFSPVVSIESGRVCRYEYKHSFKDNQIW